MNVRVTPLLAPSRTDTYPGARRVRVTHEGLLIEWLDPREKPLTIPAYLLADIDSDGAAP